jgi:hypothetical protein
MLRWVLCSALFHSALLLQGYRALKHPENPTLLRIWCLFTLIEAVTHIPILSVVIQNFLPLFWELRAVAAWSLLFVTPETVDNIFAFVWVRLGILRDVKRILFGTNTHVKAVVLPTARGCATVIATLIPLMNLSESERQSIQRSLGEIQHLLELKSKVAKSDVSGPADVLN